MPYRFVYWEVSFPVKHIRIKADDTQAVSAVLWYLAKKRSWEIRASIRKSARKVVTALTPRRSTFPKDIHSKRRSSRRLSTKLDDIPGSPKEGTSDVEKGNPKVTSFMMAEPPKQPKWAKKIGR